MPDLKNVPLDLQAASIQPKQNNNQQVSSCSDEDHPSAEQGSDDCNAGNKNRDQDINPGRVKNRQGDTEQEIKDGDVNPDPDDFLLFE